MIAIPLEMVAAMTQEQSWTLPIFIFCIWWWAPGTWRWTWLVGVESGLFGTLWAYTGATALSQFPSQRVVVSCLWVGSALSLAAVSAYNRRQNGATHPYPGY